MHSKNYPLGTTRGRRRQAMTASEVCAAAEIGRGVAEEIVVSRCTGRSLQRHRDWGERIVDFFTGYRPTLIAVHSHVGYGAPHNQDSPSAHGEPLGPVELRLTKEFFGFSPDETFVVPPDLLRVGVTVTATTYALNPPSIMRLAPVM